MRSFPRRTLTTRTPTRLSCFAAPNSEALTREVFGDEVVWVPHIRPGFPLAKLIAQAVSTQLQARAVFMAKHGLVT